MFYKLFCAFTTNKIGKLRLQYQWCSIVLITVRKFWEWANHQKYHALFSALLPLGRVVSKPSTESFCPSALLRSLWCHAHAMFKVKISYYSPLSYQVQYTNCAPLNHENRQIGRKFHFFCNHSLLHNHQSYLVKLATLYPTYSHGTAWARYRLHFEYELFSTLSQSSANGFDNPLHSALLPLGVH